MYFKSSMTWDNYSCRLHYTFSLSSEFPMLALCLLIFTFQASVILGQSYAACLTYPQCHQVFFCSSKFHESWLILKNRNDDQVSQVVCQSTLIYTKEQTLRG